MLVVLVFLALLREPRAEGATRVSPAALGRVLGLDRAPEVKTIRRKLAGLAAAGKAEAWQRRYRIRAGVEGTIAQATHVTGIRRARYLGLGKTRLEHNTAAAAINLIRLDAWWTGKPLDRTRTTHLQRLDLAA